MRVSRWLTITAALWAAVFLFIAVTLPPRARTTDGFTAGHVLRGAFHVHTTQSDGGGTREDVARAASRAGLDFVILADHGDGTAAPAAPAYIGNVLVIDGVEITTSGGHYAAFGLSQSPYPLGGPAYAVADDVRRLGGFGVAAHPDSPKADLRWRDWNTRADGLEIINGDTAWRDERAFTLMRGLIDYVFRPAPALAGFIERPARLLQRLDDRSGRFVALAGADAHARLPLTSDEEPHDSGLTVPAPSYASSFRAFTNLVDIGTPKTGFARTDASAIANAIRMGNVAVAVTGLAAPAGLRFTATYDDGGPSVGIYPMGSLVPAGPITFDVRASDVLEDNRSLVRLSLLRNGDVVATSEGPALSYRPTDDARGTWRVEATLAQRPDVPWLLSNPIVVLDAEAARAAPGHATAGDPEATLDLSDGPWLIEKHASTDAAVASTEEGQRFTYHLAGGEPSGQYAAAVRATDNTEAWDSIALTARADGPTRLWIQLRLSDSGSGQRWGRSIYLDRTPRTLRIPIRDFAPLEPRASASRPNVVQVRAALLVVDTVNSRPGRAGEVWIQGFALERTRPR